MLDLLNNLSDIVYITKKDCKQLLYANDKCKALFNITDSDMLTINRDLIHKDLDVSETASSKNWVYSCPHDNQKYIVREEFIIFNDIDAKATLAFNVNELSSHYLSTSGDIVFTEIIMSCANVLSNPNNYKESVHNALSIIGSYLKADRSYIFEFTDTCMINTFEWCNEGITPEIENLKNLSRELIAPWESYFEKNECIIMPNIEDFKDSDPESYEVLHAQGIHGVVLAPLYIGKNLIGYIGVDNPPPQILSKVTNMFSTLAVLFASTIERFRREQKLVELSFYDTLTRLQNRNCYIQRIDTLDKFPPKSIGIVYIDVNGLKEINDNFGHTKGDEVLIEMSKCMSKSFRSTDLYRVGGDEFVAICENITEQQLYVRIDKLNHLLDQSSHKPKASVGYVWKNKPDNITKLISIADQNMYDAKRKYYYASPNSSRYRHYSDAVSNLGNTEFFNEELKNNRFEVYLQPKFKPNSKSPISAEALIRYLDENNEVVPPIRFLPVLENAGLIAKVDYFVFEKACECLKKWKSSKTPLSSISINMAEQTLFDAKLVKNLDRIRTKYDIPANMIEIELLESVLKNENSCIMETLMLLKEQGYRLAADNLGSNYSNSLPLVNIDIDVIKISRQIVSVNTKKSNAIIEMFYDLCKKLDIKLSIEGIENEEQFEAISQFKDATIQGYYFSKPLPLDVFEEKYVVNS